MPPSDEHSLYSRVSVLESQMRTANVNQENLVDKLDEVKNEVRDGQRSSDRITYLAMGALGVLQVVIGFVLSLYLKHMG